MVKLVSITEWVNDLLLNVATNNLVGCALLRRGRVDLAASFLGEKGEWPIPESVAASDEILHMQASFGHMGMHVVTAKTFSCMCTLCICYSLFN